MTINEICTIADVTESVLNDWEISEKQIPSIVTDLTRKIAKAIDDARIQWDWDIRQAA